MSNAPITPTPISSLFDEIIQYLSLRMEARIEALESEIACLKANTEKNDKDLFSKKEMCIFLRMSDRTFLKKIEKLPEETKVQIRVELGGNSILYKKKECIEAFASLKTVNNLTGINKYKTGRNPKK